MVQTVVNGVTKQVPVPFSQSFGAGSSAPPSVQSGSIGLGTLTGQVGVVKTSEAKNGAAAAPAGGGHWVVWGLGEVLALILGIGLAGFGGGVLGFGML